MDGFGLSYLVWGPPKICLALAIFSFSSGLIKVFFYSGRAGGITTTGLEMGFYYGIRIGDNYFFTLSYKYKY